jgi:hypothetical protein
VTEDNRCGTEAGYVRHRRTNTPACDRCLNAHARRAKDYRTRVYLEGQKMWTDGTGTRRRLRALMALGWSGAELSRRLGRDRTWLDRIAKRDGCQVHIDTARKVAALYEQVSMTVPVGRVANATRNRAKANGWLPPLAFENIDDPDERPDGWQYQAPDRATQLADLDELNAGISEVCQRLNLSRFALEKWCERNGHTAIYSRMVRREFNQHQREAS